MRYPKFIKPNDNISFIAPSFGATTYPYTSKVKWSKRFFEKKVGLNRTRSKRKIRYSKL